MQTVYTWLSFSYYDKLVCRLNVNIENRCSCQPTVVQWVRLRNVRDDSPAPTCLPACMRVHIHNRTTYDTSILIIPKLAHIIYPLLIRSEVFCLISLYTARIYRLGWLPIDYDILRLIARVSIGPIWRETFPLGKRHIHVGQCKTLYTLIDRKKEGFLALNTRDLKGYRGKIREIIEWSCLFSFIQVC